jgi:hypothetical protein
MSLAHFLENRHTNIIANAKIKCYVIFCMACRLSIVRKAALFPSTTSITLIKKSVFLADAITGDGSSAIHI